MRRQVKTISRKVALGLCETKRFTVVNEPASGNSTVVPNNYYWMLKNIFGQLSNAGANQGVGNYQIVGSEIVNPLMKVKFQWQVPWQNMYAASAGNYQTVALCVMLVSSSDDLVANTFTSAVGFTETNDWFLQAYPFRITMNGHNVKVLKRWMRTVSPDQIQSGTPIGSAVVKGKMTYRWKRKLRYQDSAGVNTLPQNVLSGPNYYLMTSWATNVNVAGTAAVPNCQMDTYLYYKDP